MAKTFDIKNDIVLTPDYIADLMCKLACVDKNSVVLDNACGTGNLLLAAHRAGAKELYGVEFEKIVYGQALEVEGLEKAKLFNGDGLAFEVPKFVNVVLSNPPYSFPGKGLCFAYEATKGLKSGRCVVLIQENAGAGNDEGYGAKLLENNTLKFSIHLPDIFKGFASVQTAIYVFDIGRPHREDDVVKFIDFSNDGYTRSGRKTAKGTVKDADHAAERYKELLEICLTDGYTLNYYDGLVVEDTISLNGDDWTYNQHIKVDLTPTEEDFKKTVEDYMTWKAKERLRDMGITNPILAAYIYATGRKP